MVRWKEESYEPIGKDDLGNEIYPGDTVLKIDDRMYLYDMLTSDSIEILKQLGAEITEAK